MNRLFVPLILIFTKCDKLKKSEINHNIKVYSKKLESNWEISPRIIISSAKNRIGLDEILKFIDESKKESKLN